MWRALHLRARGVCVRVCDKSVADYELEYAYTFTAGTQKTDQVQA